MGRHNTTSDRLFGSIGNGHYQKESSCQHCRGNEMAHGHCRNYSFGVADFLNLLLCRFFHGNFENIAEGSGA